MRFAAGWFSYLVEQTLVLMTTAYILVLAIGVELLLGEYARLAISDGARFGISIGIIVLSLLYACFHWLRMFDPVLVWLAEGFANFNEVFDWALKPIVALAKLPWRACQRSRQVPVPETVDVNHRTG
jgi:hypothetical protein